MPALRRITRGISHLVVSATVVGCGWLPLGDGDDAPPPIASDVVSADDAAPRADAAPADTGAADAPSAGCQPACKAWQSCEANQCANKSCATSAECNGSAAPGDPEHWCVKGTCRAWECEDDDDCGQGKACNPQTYRCYAVATGCSYDAQCIDDKVCTDDSCDKDSGQCKHKPVAGCCESDAACDDGVACTKDKCVQAKCTYTSEKGCCTSDAECADSSPCTTDKCDGGTCVFTSKPGCCVGDGGCDDGQAATDDKCVANQCVHALVGMTSSCAKDADCVGTACAQGTCVSGACSWTKKASGTCCADDIGCAQDKACTVDACQGWVCKSTPAPGTGVHLWGRFDDANLSGWKITKGNSQAFFHVSDLLVFAGSGALRYGVPKQKTWAGGFPNKGEATSPSFKVPAKSATATVRVFFDGEPSAGVHQFGVRAVPSSGKVVELWTKNQDLKGNTGGKWITAKMDLSPWAGQAIQLQLWFDVAVAFPKEEGFGLLLDELRVEGACPP